MLVLVLTAAVIVVFSTSMILKFFISFEASIIPTIILITNAGSYPERASANIFIILITITSSLPMIMVISQMENQSKGILSSIKKKIIKKEELI